MTSQKVSHGRTSLLGTNILRGGCQTYSADVLTKNWFDQRLADDYKPNRGGRASKALEPEVSAEEKLQAFNRNQRTDITPLYQRGRRPGVIASWTPEDAYYRHPAITSPFETIYELTLGDPKWKNKPIPVGANIVSFPNSPSSFTTEHRDAFKNPCHLASFVPTRENEAVKHHLRPSAQNRTDDSIRDIISYTTEPVGIPSLASTRKTSLKSTAIPPAASEDTTEIDIPCDRLIPTHHIGIPKDYYALPARYQLDKTNW